MAIKEHSLAALRKAIEGYCAISDQTWGKLCQISVPVNLQKAQPFIRAGVTPHFFGFVYTGLLRAYTTGGNGNEYNKIFFAENTFPGAMVALLTASASTFTIEALEDAYVLQIDFSAYRQLLHTCDDLKWFHILYLEKNWILDKEKREVAFVQNSATERYVLFKQNYASLEGRIPQFHVASHLGITPTQLSRIRKSLSRC